jgi:hypothetical protein
MSLQFPGFADPADLARQARDFAEAIDHIVASGAPPADDLLRAPALDWWRPTTRTAPALIGLVAGHPRLRAGATTMTSELFAIDADAGWARTWSRLYRLGRPIDFSLGRLQ